MLRYITLKRIDFLNHSPEANETDTAILNLPGPEPSVKLKSMVAAYEKQIILKMLERKAPRPS